MVALQGGVGRAAEAAWLSPAAQLRGHRRPHPPTATPSPTPVRPPACTRTRILLRHTMETPPHGRRGVDLHLGQKPKLGGRYTDITLIYISYHVGTLYIHVSIFFLSFCYLLFISVFQNTKRPKIFLLFLFISFFSI